jgi:DNA-binding MarR family transcriptional regulator
MTPRLPPRLDARVTYLLGRVAAVAGQRANAELAELDLDTRHYVVLAAVESGDGPSQRMISDLLGIDRATVVALTDNLQRRRLLRRARSTRDRRAYALYLTDAGRRLVGRAHALMDRCDRELLAALPDDTRAELAGILRAVLSARSAFPSDAGGKLTADELPGEGRSTRQGDRTV